MYGQDFYNEWYMNRSFTIPACACLLILPMCYSRRIDFLRVPSTLGVIAIFYLVGLVVYEYYAGNHKSGPIKTKPTHFMDVFLVVPNIFFGYDGHLEVVSIYSCMKHRTFKHITFVVLSAVTICFVCYTLPAVFAYLTFGSLVKEDILMSYDCMPYDCWHVYAGMVAIALKSITMYPVLLFCGREAIESFFTERESLRTTNIAASSTIASNPSNEYRTYGTEKITKNSVIASGIYSMKSSFMNIFMQGRGVCLLYTSDAADE